MRAGVLFWFSVTRCAATLRVISELDDEASILAGYEFECVCRSAVYGPETASFENLTLIALKDDICEEDQTNTRYEGVAAVGQNVEDASKFPYIPLGQTASRFFPFDTSSKCDKTDTYWSQDAMYEYIVASKTKVVLMWEFDDRVADGAYTTRYSPKDRYKGPEYTAVFATCSGEARFRQALYDLAERGGVQVALEVTENPWKTTQEGVAYVLCFRVCLALVYLGTAGVAGRFFVERARSKTGRKGTVPLFVTLVESASLLVVGMSLAVDGWWGTNNFTFAAKGVVLTLLSGPSFGTTIFTAIFWSDMNAKMNAMKTSKSSSLMTRHRWKLTALVMFSLVADAVGVGLFLSGYFPGAETLVGGYFLCVQSCAGFYFIKSARSFLNATSATLNKSNNKSSAKTKDDSAMTFVRYMSKWMMVSGLFMVMYCAGAVMVGTPFVWTPVGWAVSWCWLLTARWGISFGQIFACRMRKTKKKKKKRTSVGPRTSMSSTNASSAYQPSSRRARSSTTQNDSTRRSSGSELCESGQSQTSRVHSTFDLKERGNVVVPISKNQRTTT